MTANYFAHNKKKPSHFDLASNYSNLLIVNKLKLRTYDTWHCKFAGKNDLTSVNVVTILVM